MANEAAKVTWSETDMSEFIGQLQKGIYCALGRTRRGPVGKSLKVTSWPDFKRNYGGFLADSDFPLIMKQAFDRGAVVYIARAVHLTDPTDIATMVATPGTLTVNDETAEVSTLTLDIDLVALNSIAGTVNGVALTATVFAADHATTLAALAAKIQALDDVATAAVSAARVVTVTGVAGKALTFTGFAVTLGATQPTITPAEVTAVRPTITLTLKDPGAFSAKCAMTVTTNADDTTKKDVVITYSEDSTLTERYTRVDMTPPEGVTPSETYLVDLINAKSFMYEAEDEASASTGATANPANGTYTFSAGNDGTSGLVEADYIGDSASGVGLYSFDDVEDAYGVCTPEIQTRTMIAAGDTYCSTRGDMFYMGETPTSVDENAIAAFKRGGSPYSGAAFNSSFLAMFSGHMEVTDPLTNRKKFISNMGHVIAIQASSDTKANPWFAAAGLERGLLKGVDKLDYNMGTPGKVGALDKVAQAQVNPFVNFPNDGIVLWGNKTTQVKQSALQNLHVRKLLLYMQKAIRPANRYSLFNPNDPTEWKRIWMRVKPLMDELQSKRAISGYLYQGDQDVESATDAVINTQTDLDDGRYKVRIYIKPINSIEVLGFEAIITASSVDFAALAD